MKRVILFFIVLVIVLHGSEGKGKDLKGSSEQDIFKWFQTYSEVVSLVEQKSFRRVDFSSFIQNSLKLRVLRDFRG